jgi:hypothetical protein
MILAELHRITRRKPYPSVTGWYEDGCWKCRLCGLEIDGTDTEFVRSWGVILNVLKAFELFCIFLEVNMQSQCDCLHSVNLNFGYCGIN